MKKKRKKAMPSTLDTKACLVHCTGGVLLTMVIAMAIRTVVQLIGENSEYTPAFHVLSYGVPLAVGHWIANLILHLFQIARGEKFLSAVGEHGTVKDGFLWHMKTYWLTEVLLLACFSIVFLFVYITGNGMCPMWLFYHYLGIPLGFVVSVLYMTAAEAVNIVLAQRGWIIRARRIDKE